MCENTKKLATLSSFLDRNLIKKIKILILILIYFYLGSTSLHYAARNGHTEIVKILLENGANVSTKDDDGKKDDNTYNIYIILSIK